jgi:hypothetical protein
MNCIEIWQRFINIDGEIPTMSDPKTLTTADGIPVADNQNPLTAGDRGPVLMQVPLRQSRNSRQLPNKSTRVKDNST